MALGDDAELVRGALNGHPDRFDDLARRYARPMFAICLSRVRDPATAEDMVQETLLRGYRNLASLVEPAKFGSWLYGIAVRTCLDWLKSKKRTEVSYEALDNPGLGARDDERTDDRAEQLRAALSTLPENLREVVVLRYFQKLAYRDIGRLLGIAPATVNLHLSKARLLLRQSLKENV